ncbi:GNAT family N-acetyltransferase [Loigolactobacillus jiayinensis]|uniref:GNAT family N-acetyltransferase n=1 Tax=Loigolactobacillus jiayinensis TaxID=2486016 RepID=A0ABW1RGW8_9LACO|nr:GNAT family N-acetyltransferase [Loigolactobacillus jiayinensis]
MQLRKITPADNLQVKAIIQQALAAYHLNLPGTAYFDPQLDHLAEYYAQLPNSEYWVLVTATGKIAGGAGIGMFNADKKIAELQKLYIAPEFRGQGLAHQLMRQTLDFAQQYYTQLYLETFSILEPANQLYHKYNFQRLAAPLVGSEHSACDVWYLRQL